jgi:hypothetical protein
MEVLDIVRDECQKLERRLAYVGVTSLCTAEHTKSSYGDCTIKLQITNIDGTRRYFAHNLAIGLIPRNELRLRTRHILHMLTISLVNEVSE